MTIIYSLVNAPSGLSIDPETGDVFASGPIAQGTYENIEVWTTNTITGQSKQCDQFNFSCDEFDSFQLGCDECLSQHLEETPHLTKQEVDECVSKRLVDWIPPEVPKDCCNRRIFRYSVCGRCFDFLDWKGTGIVEINFTPKTHAYLDEPDPAEALIAPQFDINLQTTPDFPLLTFAGPFGANGKISQITHISNGKEWIPLCCDGGGGSIVGTNKCVLITEDQMQFPIRYDSQFSTWQIGSQVVNFPPCLQIEESFCVVGAGLVAAPTPLATTGENLPDLASYFENNNVVIGNSEVVGCGGVLQENSQVQDGQVATLNFGAWQGNGGNILYAEVESMRLCFDVTGNNVDIGVGMYDIAASQEWQTVSNVSGPSVTQYSEHAQITGPGSYEIEFTPKLLAQNLETNAVEASFFGIDGNEKIQNYRLKITSQKSEPCGLIENDLQLAQLLTAVDPNGIEWFVDDDGNICAFTAEPACSLYNAPNFDISQAGIECCAIENISFPLTYNPLNDGWVIGSTNILYGGVGVFQDAEQLADWMNNNDTFNNFWVPQQNDQGLWSICSFIDPALKSEYLFMSFNGSDVFKCIIEDVSFPLAVSDGDGWVIGGQLIPYPSNQDFWFIPNALSSWMTANDPNGITWQPFPDNTISNSWKICAQVPETLCDQYGQITYTGSETFCCQAENVTFPVQYDNEEDGWIVNNTVIPFAGSGVFNTADELLQFMLANDPNGFDWQIYPGNNGGSNICAYMPTDPIDYCSNYTGITISGGDSYWCDFNNIPFPYNYNRFRDGWEVNGQVIPFDGDGTFETPQEFANWLTSNDPNGFDWQFESTGQFNIFNFCAFMPTSSIQGYGGPAQSEEVYWCDMTIRFPFEYDPNDGWEVNGQVIPFSGDGIFETPQEFANWMTSNDPNGNDWQFEPTSQSDLFNFCASIPISSIPGYGGQASSNITCNDLTVSFPYTPDSGAGWLINGTTVSYVEANGGPITFGTPAQFVDWLNDNDPFGYEWYYSNSSTSNFHSFCAILADSEAGTYQGFYGGNYFCVGGPYNFPITYNNNTQGWFVGSSFFPFGTADPPTDGSPNTGTFNSLQEVLDFVQSNDPDSGHVWFTTLNGEICTYLKASSGIGYGTLQL